METIKLGRLVRTSCWIVACLLVAGIVVVIAMMP